MIGGAAGVLVLYIGILEPYDNLLAVIILLVQCYCQVKLTQIIVSSFALENGQIQGFLHAF